MISVGESGRFAIETLIHRALASPGLRGIGYFVIDVGGLRYGVQQPDATALACSFDEVERRVGDRGKHVAPFAEGLAAAESCVRWRSHIDSSGRPTATRRSTTEVMCFNSTSAIRCA